MMQREKQVNAQSSNGDDVIVFLEGAAGTAQRNPDRSLGYYTILTKAYRDVRMALEMEAIKVYHFFF